MSKKDSEQELYEKQLDQMTRLADKEILSILYMSSEEHKEVHRAMKSSNALYNLVKLSENDNNNR